MKILYFFIFLWVIFALLGPDPDPATQINADPDADLDPQPCNLQLDDFALMACLVLECIVPGAAEVWTEEVDLEQSLEERHRLLPVAALQQQHRQLSCIHTTYSCRFNWLISSGLPVRVGTTLSKPQSAYQCCGSVTFWYGSGCVPLTNGSKCGSGRPKNIRRVSYESGCGSGKFTSFVIKKSHSRNQGSSYNFCLMMEGSGAEFVLENGGSGGGSGSGRLKIIRILGIRMRIRNTAANTKIFLVWALRTYPECRGCRAPPRRDAGRPAPQCRAAAAAAASAGNPCTPLESRPPKTCTVRRGVTDRLFPWNIKSVLRIRDVYIGSRIKKQQQKRRGEKILPTFFCSH